MPTSMPRCQVLMQPDVYAKMKLLAAFDKRTLSAMCASLIEVAMELPRYKAMLDEARVAMGEEHVKPDPRKARKQEHRPEPAPTDPAEVRARLIEKEVSERTGWKTDEQGRSARAVGKECEMVDDGEGGLYNASEYEGLTNAEIKTRFKEEEFAMSLQEAQQKVTHAITPVTRVQHYTLQLLFNKKLISRELYEALNEKRPLKDGEIKEEVEKQMLARYEEVLRDNPLDESLLTAEETLILRELRAGPQNRRRTKPIEVTEPKKEMPTEQIDELKELVAALERLKA